MESKLYSEQCRKLISDLKLDENVLLNTDFLDFEESVRLLAAADILVFPQQETNESASGAVRIGLTSRRPVLCSPSPIFNDVKEIIHFLKGSTPSDISNGVIEVLQDAALMESLVEKQDNFVRHRDWGVLGKRLGNMIRSLLINQNFENAI